MNASDAPSKLEETSPFALSLFRYVWGAATLSNLGNTIQAVGAGWLMIQLSGSPEMVALVQASASLPILLFALWAGAMADNLDRRKVVLVCQVAMLCLSALLAVMTIAGNVTPISLLILTFLIGSGAAINWPAMQVVVTDIVPRSALPRAVAWNGMAMNIARSVGPAIGGAVITFTSAATAFLLNAFSYIGMLLVLLRWRERPAPRLLPRERLGTAMAAGVRYAIMSPVISAVFFRAVSYGATAGAIQALMPIVARDQLRGGAFTFGLLLAAFGLGAIAAALLSGRLRRRWSSEHLVRIAAVIAAVGSANAAISTSLPVTLVAMAIAGASWLTVLSAFNVTIQLSSPRWVAARALSLYQMGVHGGVALGSWVAGMIATRVGLEMALLVAASGLILVALAGFRWPIPTTTDASTRLREGWSIPETSTPLNFNSGPIAVMIEYRIAKDNALAFMSLMQERSRVMQRDGARHWSLARDLADDILWIERYALPTWLDYVQLNQRRTQADLTVQDKIHELMLPGTNIVVHRLLERQSGALPWSNATDDDVIQTGGQHG